MKRTAIIKTHNLGFVWQTQDPFLFCVHHLDNYPAGNEHLGPQSSLSGRNIGNDFEPKDGWRMYHGRTVPGFPAHPHRGFETVTFALQGLIDHADSNGAAGRYGNRDVQWMTAGSGLQHSEMFPLLKKDEPNTCELFQIWLNLPAAKKFAKPAYKMLWNDTIPKVTETDMHQKKIEIDVVAGKYKQFTAPAPAPDSWAADPGNNVNIWQIQLEAGAEWTLPAAKSIVTRSLYFFEGEGVSIDELQVAPKTGIELDARFDVPVKNGEKTSRLLLLQGKPIAEPVAQYGPFVMNSMDEIDQAFADFRRSQFGGWPWPRTDVVHGSEPRRFARFDNGEEDNMDK